MSKDSLTPSVVSDLNINVLPVKCPLCDEKLLRLSRDHALKHGYKSLSEYRKANGINYLTLPQRSKEDFKRLYNIDFQRWVVGYRTSSEEMRYVTKQYDPTITEYKKSASKFPLNDGNFNGHFRGDSPLAIFAYKSHARFFAFDIDSREQAEADTFRLINQLRRLGIEDKDIHVSFSGGKGYHIELFIDKHLRHEDWYLFGEYVRYHAGISKEQIEYRPTESNGHALKLPLTFHPKTKKFAGYCDVDTLEMYDIIKSHDYLHEIEQMDTGMILDIIREARRTLSERRAEEARKQAEEARRQEEQRKKESESQKAVQIRNIDLFQSTEEKEETAKRILTHGLPGKGNRWLAMRDTLIPYLKIVQGNEPEEIAEILREWTAQEIRKGNVRTPYNDCLIEIDELMESWYPKVNEFYSVVRDIEITRAEVDWVMSVIERGGTRNARDLLWVLLLLSKAYSERYKREGTFFASRDMVQRLLSKPKKISHTTIARQRRWLAENGYLTFEVPKHSYIKRLATTYKLSDIGEVTPEIIDSLTFTDDADGRKLLTNVAEKLYTPTALKKLKVIN